MMGHSGVEQPVASMRWLFNNRRVRIYRVGSSLLRTLQLTGAEAPIPPAATMGSCSVRLGNVDAANAVVKGARGVTIRRSLAVGGGDGDSICREDRGDCDTQSKADD